MFVWKRPRLERRASLFRPHRYEPGRNAVLAMAEYDAEANDQSLTAATKSERYENKVQIIRKESQENKTITSKYYNNNIVINKDEVGAAGITEADVSDWRTLESNNQPGPDPNPAPGPVLKVTTIIKNVKILRKSLNSKGMWEKTHVKHFQHLNFRYFQVF